MLFQWGSAADMLWHFRQHACLSVSVQSSLVSSSKRAFPFLVLTYSNLSPELRSAAGPRLAFSYAENAKEKGSVTLWEVTEEWHPPSKSNIAVSDLPDLEVGNNNPAGVLLSLWVAHSVLLIFLKQVRFTALDLSTESGPTVSRKAVDSWVRSLWRHTKTRTLLHPDIKPKQ